MLNASEIGCELRIWIILIVYNLYWNYWMLIFKKIYIQQTPFIHLSNQKHNIVHASYAIIPAYLVSL